VAFESGVEIGGDISIRYLNSRFDAIVLAIGAGQPRDIEISGRNLAGIHFAVPFLTMSNRRSAGDTIPNAENVSAKGKKVLVIGGGDTGADCIGTCSRQQARSITQIEILPKPLEHPADYNPNWPDWPDIVRSSSSHEEGCERMWSIQTKEFVGDAFGRVKSAKCVKVEWTPPDDKGRRSIKEIAGTEFEIEAEMVLIAAGFTHPEHGRILQDLELALDSRGNFKVNDAGMTSADGVFAAGDCASGASLVVRAINSGRRISEAVHGYLSA
jgi:glutamate synthase (NADPH) small chain